MMRNTEWKDLTAGIGTAVVTIALGACSMTEFLSGTSDMTNPESGVFIDYRTSFATLPSASVLTLVYSASTMLFFTDDADGRVCFGLEAPPLGQSLENACLRFANVPKWTSNDLGLAARNSRFPGPVRNSQFDHRVGASLVRDCGQYALNSQDGMLESGAGCGLLGAFLADEENIAAAKSVWEQAPGCHTHDVFGDPMNGCMRFIVGEGDTNKEGQQWLAQDGYDHRDLYSADKPKLLAMAKASCLKEFDYASCAFLVGNAGVKLDLVALRRAVQDRRDAISARRDDKQRYDHAPDSMSGFLAKSEQFKAEAKSNESEQRRARLERNARLRDLVSPLLASQ